MSRSSNTLTVSTAPLAEISVLDGSMNTVARSVGGLTKELSPGLYKIRVRNGPGVEEELVSLDQDRSVEIKAPVDAGLNDFQDIAADTLANEGTVFGNLAIVPKAWISGASCPSLGRARSGW